MEFEATTVAITVKIVLLRHDSPLIIKSVNDNCNFFCLNKIYVDIADNI